jgi:hypothetical protein
MTDAASHTLPPDLLRRFSSASVEALDTVWPVKYVVSADGASLVAPLPVKLAQEESLALLVPDRRGLPGTAQRDEPEARVLVQVHELTDWRLLPDPDRWQAYHGRPSGPAWWRLEIAAVRWSGHNGAGIDDDSGSWRVPNPLAHAEPKLCKRANADRAALARAASSRLGVTLHEPLVVGVDAWGLDVRHAGGVARWSWPEALSDAAAAEAAIAAWLAA